MNREARMCYSKKRYTTEKAARKVANDCERKRGDAIRVYLCPCCGGYHLTSVEKQST